MASLPQIPTEEEFMNTGLVTVQATCAEPCPICYEKYGGAEEGVVQTPQCRHTFHKACIDQWLSKKNTCPMCRRLLFLRDDDWFHEATTQINDTVFDLLPAHLSAAGRTTDSEGYIAQIGPVVEHVRQHLPVGMWRFSDEALEFCVTSRIMQNPGISFNEWAKLSQHRRARINRRPTREMTNTEAVYVENHRSAFTGYAHQALGHTGSEGIATRIRCRTLTGVSQRLRERSADTQIWKLARDQEFQHVTLDAATCLHFDRWVNDSELPDMLAVIEWGRGSVVSARSEGEEMVIEHEGRKTNFVTVDYEGGD